MKVPLLIVALILGLFVAVVACENGEEDLTAVVTATPLPNGTTSTVAVPTPTPTARVFHDPAAGYSVNYPATWEARPVTVGKDIRDFLSAVEFFDPPGTLRGSVYVFQNPDALALRDWIANHDSILLEGATEERKIGESLALVAPLNFQGRPSPHAYLELGSNVIAVSALTNEDFDALAAGFHTLG